MEVNKLRIIDKAIYNLIHKQNFSVPQDGKDVRFQVLFSTPEEALAKKVYPCFYIDSLFDIKTPEWWQNERITFEENTIDSRLTDKKFQKSVCVFYSYRIGFYVLYRQHLNYTMEKVIKLFPNKLYLSIVNPEGEDEIIFFRREGIIKLDELEGKRKIFRRDFELVTQLLFEEEEIESLVRPFAGIDLSIGKN
jgi:hypothetical protein